MHSWKQATTRPGFDDSVIFGLVGECATKEGEKESIWVQLSFYSFLKVDSLFTACVALDLKVITIDWGGIQIALETFAP